VTAPRKGGLYAAVQNVWMWPFPDDVDDEAAMVSFEIGTPCLLLELNILPAPWPGAPDRVRYDLTFLVEERVYAFSSYSFDHYFRHPNRRP